MIVLSLNAWGFGGDPKGLSLKRLVTESRPDFIMIKETICSGSKGIEVFHKILRDWFFCSNDSIIVLGGILSA
jgi:hypothetical protein